jgi:hypothetical protein
MAPGVRRWDPLAKVCEAMEDSPLRSLKYLIAAVWLGGLILAAAWRPYTGAQAAGTSVSLQPASSVARRGQSFEVTVWIDDATNLGSHEVRLSYDPDIIQFESARGGDLLPSSGKQITCLTGVVDNVLGSAQFGCVTSGSVAEQGVAGSGVLSVFQFNAKGNGVSSVTFSKIELADLDGENCCGQPLLNEAAIRVIGASDPNTQNLPATPTQNPRALTPTAVPADAAASPTQVRELLSAGASGGSSGSGATQPSGTLAGSASNGASSSGDDSFPVAGYGTQPEDDGPFTTRVLVTLVTGILALAVGITLSIRRRKTEA